ncbi:hypothetical protein [Bradyrhizobium sp. 169]|uniref:hypothetical protein n=1 Tax=Bradyrhizobium sp. 169 TaxID=2782640 RepID=UPI001FF855AB|nr:hypothetical protein [Bradyrhizobium sp. 169]MCK1586899.1 hypothetical protein [Bradyrhizobium sp. 169]
MSKTKYKRRKSDDFRSAKEKPMSTELVKLMAEDAGKGVSQAFEDVAWWLPDDLWSRPWIGAIELVDRTKGKNKQPLIELLRSERRIARIERCFLIDLLDRYQFNVPANDLCTRALALLRVDSELTADQREQLADLIQIRDLKRPAHRPLTPAYNRTDADAHLEWDALRVRRLQKDGGKVGGAPMTLESAVDKVAPDPRDASLLEAHMAGKHGSSRRMKKRRPKS